MTNTLTRALVAGIFAGAAAPAVAQTSPSLRPPVGLATVQAAPPSPLIGAIQIDPARLAENLLATPRDAWPDRQLRALEFIRPGTLAKIAEAIPNAQNNRTRFVMTSLQSAVMQEQGLANNDRQAAERAAQYQQQFSAQPTTMPIGPQLDRLRQTEANRETQTQAAMAQMAARHDADPVIGPYIAAARTDLAGAKIAVAEDIAALGRVALSGVVGLMRPPEPAARAAPEPSRN